MKPMPKLCKHEHVSKSYPSPAYHVPTRPQLPPWCSHVCAPIRQFPLVSRQLTPYHILSITSWLLIFVILIRWKHILFKQSIKQNDALVLEKAIEVGVTAVGDEQDGVVTRANL